MEQCRKLVEVRITLNEISENIMDYYADNWEVLDEVLELVEELNERLLDLLTEPDNE